MKRFLVGLLVFGLVAAVAYLATLGCRQWIHLHASAFPLGLKKELGLTPDQRQHVEALERIFLVQKQSSCGKLCAKRAELIQLLRRADPDRAALAQVLEEVGQEQGLLEKATLDHFLILHRYLDPPQKYKLVAMMTERLRTACERTACGVSPGCFVEGTELGEGEGL